MVLRRLRDPFLRQLRLDMLTPQFQELVEGVQRLTPFAAQVYPASWRGRYPHLMPIDVAIWNRFLDAHGSEFLGFQYDITLGYGAKPPSTFSGDERKLLWTLTVKRADCLGIRRDGVTLFEVKPRLGMAAVGQCIAYRDLWRQQFGDRWPVLTAAVVEQDEPDLNYVCSVERVIVVVV